MFFSNITYLGNGTVRLGLVDLQSFLQPAQLLWRKFPRFLRAARPLVLTSLKPFVQQDESVRIPV